MGKIVFDLLPKQKPRKHNTKVEVDLYPYATELYEELANIGIIGRTMSIPQLGVIRVSKKLAKTRYDYIMLQLYLHQLIKMHLQGHLKLTYNNCVIAREFRDGYRYNSKENTPSIGDILQLLTIAYNIGHFYNTFTASRAAVMMASEDRAFYDLIKNASCDARYQMAATKILDGKNYQRFHLLNSILVLERCDQTKQSVSLSKEILYSYLNENALPDEHKLKYTFSIFRNVRTVSYIAYDLQIANTPLTIDLCNEKAMLLILKELLSEYNNNQSSIKLIDSISKLLDDTVYNENSNAICYYKISRRMVSLLANQFNNMNSNYYKDLFVENDSVFNRSYSHKRDFSQSQILKLTFSKEDRWISESLLSDLERIHNTRVGYYDRHLGEQTVLVSIKKTCTAYSKIIAAFKVMKCVISSLRRSNNVIATDVRFLLCTKFFLYYLFDENPVIIKPTIDKEKCVICTRGKKARISGVQQLLDNSIGNDSEFHETQFMLQLLNADTINDTSITVPASIVVYQKDFVGRKLCEFDGIIIHPMRRTNQIIFMEAKNTVNRPSYGKKCLKEKLDKLSINYFTDDIIIDGYDAFLKYSI